jgi:D-alanyl-D-alanine carboxypeptidase (penicillin-binding protein 5/6)
MIRLRARSRVGVALLALLAASTCAGIAAGASSSATPDRPDADATRITELVPPPKVTAQAWVVYDEAGDEPIAGVDAASAHPIASLAKLMTALVTVEHAQQSAIVTVPPAVNALPSDASVMGLHAGEKWTVHDLLRGMLVYSANDAAVALAVHVGETEDKFVAMMNDSADEHEMTTTRFASASGLDLSGTQSTASPLDLVILTKAALADPDIAAAVATKHVSLQRPGTTSDADKIELKNRNPLLHTYPGVDGVKTGFTDPAGYMLITHHIDDETDGRLIVVTAHSSSEATRITDGKALLDWGRSLRHEVRIADGGDEIATVPIIHSGRRVHVFICDDLTATGRIGQSVKTRIVLPRMMRGPISPGDEVGALRASIAGADTVSVPLCSATRVRKDTLGGRLRTAADEYDTAWNAGVDEVKDAWQKLAG